MCRLVFFYHCRRQDVYSYNLFVSHSVMLLAVILHKPVKSVGRVEMEGDEVGGKDAVKKLFAHYRRERDGIRNAPEMATICLICGSIHIVTKPGEPHQRYCRDCGFAFFRYDCEACGSTVDGRDPQNPGCDKCGLRVCTCGACGCSTDCNHL